MTPPVSIQRGPEPRRYNRDDEQTMAHEFARFHRLRRLTRKRFLVRRHASAWSKLFPNHPVWIVWDRDTEKFTEHPTHEAAMDKIETVLMGDRFDHSMAAVMAEPREEACS